MKLYIRIISTYPHQACPKIEKAISSTSHGASVVGLGRDFIANARLTFPQTSKISGADSDLDPELKEYKVKDG